MSEHEAGDLRVGKAEDIPGQEPGPWLVLFEEIGPGEPKTIAVVSMKYEPTPASAALIDALRSHAVDLGLAAKERSGDVFAGAKWATQEIQSSVSLLLHGIDASTKSALQRLVGQAPLPLEEGEGDPDDTAELMPSRWVFTSATRPDGDGVDGRVSVSSADVEAARTVVRLSEELGEPVSASVRAVAEAAPGKPSRVMA